MHFSKASLFALFSVATLATAMDYHQLAARDADPSELYVRNNEPRELFTRDGHLFAREAELHQMYQRDADASAQQAWHYKRDILKRVAKAIGEQKLTCELTPCIGKNKEVRNAICSEAGCGTCDHKALIKSNQVCRGPGESGAGIHV